METIQSINLIATHPTVRNDRPFIAGTTITVADIAAVKIYQMLDTDALADYFDVSLPQVYAALAYYYSHKTEIDDDIQASRQLAQTMKEQRIGSRHQPLFR